MTYRKLISNILNRLLVIRQTVTQVSVTQGYISGTMNIADYYTYGVHIHEYHCIRIHNIAF